MTTREREGLSEIVGEDATPDPSLTLEQNGEADPGGVVAVDDQGGDRAVGKEKEFRSTGHENKVYQIN